jgi:hypothetical protein
LDNSRYQIATWDIDQAARLIELLESYPDVRYKNNRGAAYYEAFKYASYAQAEAILRFPDSFPAAFWRWGLAFNLARSGDARAGDHYGDLIVTALNGGQTSPDDLNSWMLRIEPRLALRPVQLEPIPGYQQTFLLELRARGSAFIILLEEGGIYEYVLLGSFFDFVNPAEFDFIHADFTLDEAKDLAIFQVSSPNNKNPVLPQLFDLASVPIKQVGFRPDETIPLDLDHRSRWSALPNEAGGNDLQFHTTVFPACPVNVLITYRWGGALMEREGAKYDMQVTEELIEFCDPNLDHVFLVWGLAPVLDLMEPELANLISGTAPLEMSTDLKEKWAIRLGIFHALNGEWQKSSRFFNDLINSSNAEESPWAQLAAQFLDAYKSEQDLYVACKLTELCDLQVAVEKIIEMTPTPAYPTVFDRLLAARVPVRASGFFDFEGDNDLERWLSIRPEGRIEVDFWITTQEPAGIKALFVGTIDTAIPELSMLESPENESVVQLGGFGPFELKRQPDNSSTYLFPYVSTALYAPERVQVQTLTALQNLLAGTDPSEIRAELLDLEASPTFICPYVTCENFIYTLALAHELAGDEQSAVDRYLELWRVYSKSPYTTIARLKLVGEALLPTATATPTPTQTLTRTPTTTGTPDLTTTISATPSPSPSITLTPEPTGTASS